MACKQPIPALISCKPLALGKARSRRSLAAALTLSSATAEAGLFGPTATFGEDGQDNETELEAAASADVFVAK
jgi:hypothetical protein